MGELRGGMQESVSKVIEIKDANFEIFHMLLCFLYTDDLEVISKAVEKKVALQKSPAATDTSSTGDSDSQVNQHASTLQSILALSHQYQVHRLRLWCEEQLCKHICKDQVCSILCQAHMYEA